jgi:hypothetical protein
MKTSTTVRFVLAIIVVTLGFAALFFNELGGLVVSGFAVLSLPRRRPEVIPQPPCEKYRRNVAVMRAVLFLGVLTVVAAAVFATPAVAGGIKRIVFHPVFVVVFWLFWLQAIVRHWIDLRGQADAS